MPQEVRTTFKFSKRKELTNLVNFTEASNCGGVAVSGLEMAQNSQRLTWSTEEVDSRLNKIMTDCYNVRSLTLLSIFRFIFLILLKICYDVGSKWSTEGAVTGSSLPSLVAGANVAGFIKVDDAMRAQGDWW